MTATNPQVPWTDEQWTRINRVIQEEATRARVAASFLPLYGSLSPETDFVRRELIGYQPWPQPPPVNRVAIDDRNVSQLATLQVRMRVRGAQMADPELRSVLALFRRAANVLARLEDAVVFNRLEPDPANPGRFAPPAGVAGLGDIWEITGGEVLRGLLDLANATRVVPPRPRSRGLVRAVSRAIGQLEADGHFGPFAVVLDHALFTVAQTPDPNSLVLPQDRIIPFLGGGSLLRSSTLPLGYGVVVALGGAPVELVVAKDMCFEFLQVTHEPEFIFRVCEKMVLRIKEPDAIITLGW